VTPKFRISASDRGVNAIQLPSRGRSDRSHKKKSTAAVKHWCSLAQIELDAYFARRLTAFSAPYDIGHLPRFTRSVLELTAKIPYGEVRSYEWVAGELGKPKAARAVGNALARNPVPILIPCHRVVRSDGTIGGFALGSDWKKKLLALEKTRKNKNIDIEVR
jgi:methylated-DNA-[protein]-cysteine S-methyltransferase